MADNKRISDLNQITNPIPGADGDLLVTARAGASNKKITFSDLSQTSAEEANSAFVTGDQDINGIKNFLLMPQHDGSNLVTHSEVSTVGSNLDLVSGLVTNLSGYSVLITGNQVISGNKTFRDKIVVSGNMTAGDGGVVFSDGREPKLWTVKPDSLALAFKDDVYVTGSDLFVDGTVKTKKIDSLENIVGVLGATIMTDGRDPDLFEQENTDNALITAFSDGVYITGSNLYVNGTAYVKKFETLEDIEGVFGQTIITDGRDPDSFPNDDDTLTFAFKNGVYVTGGDLHVDGRIHYKSITPMKQFISVNYIDNHSPGNVFLPLHAGTDTYFQPSIEDTNGAYGNIIVTPYSGKVASVTFYACAEASTVAADWQLRICHTGQGEEIQASHPIRPYETGISVAEYVEFDPPLHTNTKFDFTEKQHFSTGEYLAISLYRPDDHSALLQNQVTGNFTVEIDYYPIPI